MSNMLWTVTLKAANGIARDDCVNTFAIDNHAVGLPSGAAQTAIADALAGFYNTVQTSGKAVADFINGSRSRAAGDLVMKAYDITAALQRERVVNAKGVEVWRTPNYGSPFSTFGRTLAAQGLGGSSLPAEVAVCMSLRTATRDTVQTEVPDADDDGATDRPKARRTGRIYIGPLHTGALAAAGDPGDRKVLDTLRTTLTQAATGLQTALKAMGTPPAGFSWDVWSRADGQSREVHQVVVDDAFDTMRKRGQRATATTVATFA